MVAGEDRVTFENYVDVEAKAEGRSKNDAWYFSTYGPPSEFGQTWDEHWANGVGGLRRLGTTVVSASSPDPSPYTNDAAASSTADLLKRLSTTEPAEKMALEAELGKRWLEVTVKVVKAQEGTDEVYVKVRGSKTVKTKQVDLKAGKTKRFRIPLAKLLPIKDKIVIEVFDSDAVSDDMISNITFTAPFKTAVDNRPWDGATYHTSVKFER